MKVVSREEFLALPEGTLYTKFMPCYTEGLAVKHKSIPDDWFYTQLIASTDNCEGLDELCDGKELPFSADWSSRDGAFDNDQMFIIYSTEDVKAFAETLLGLIT